MIFSSVLPNSYGGPRTKPRAEPLARNKREALIRSEVGPLLKIIENVDLATATDSFASITIVAFRGGTDHRLVLPQVARTLFVRRLHRTI